MAVKNSSNVDEIEKNYHSPHSCPVCGKFEFERHNSMDCCEECGWCDDVIQEKDPDYRGGANKMSLNEAKKAFKNGEQIN